MLISNPLFNEIELFWTRNLLVSFQNLNFSKKKVFLQGSISVLVKWSFFFHKQTAIKLNVNASRGYEFFAHNLQIAIVKAKILLKVETSMLNNFLRSMQFEVLLENRQQATMEYRRMLNQKKKSFWCISNFLEGNFWS